MTADSQPYVKLRRLADSLTAEHMRHTAAELHAIADELEVAATEPGALYCWSEAPNAYTACDRRGGHLGLCSWASAEPAE